jgi:glutamate-5-semialdehyde dehydrogenase
VVVGSDALLVRVADSLERAAAPVLAANQEDMAAAGDTLAPALRQRLGLSAAKLATVADGVRQLAHAGDPIGRVRVRTTI